MFNIQIKRYGAFDKDMLKKFKIFIWTLILFGSVSCVDNDNIGPIEKVNFLQFDFPQGNALWDKEIEQIAKDWGMYIIYKNVDSTHLNRMWTIPYYTDPIYVCSEPSSEDIQIYLDLVQEWLLGSLDKTKEEDKKQLAQIEDNFHKAINDDLNMPLAMSYVWELAKFEKKNIEVAKLLAKFDTVLGLKIDEKNQEKSVEIPQEIKELLEQRKIARENKDWAKSDELRDLIAQKGYIVKDTKQGQTVEKK